MVEAIIQRPSVDFIQVIQQNADICAHAAESLVKYGQRGYISWVDRKISHLRNATNLRAFADAIRDANNLPDEDIARRVGAIKSTIEDLNATMSESGFKKVMIDTLESRMAGFKVVAGNWSDVYNNDIARLDLF